VSGPLCIDREDPGRYAGVDLGYGEWHLVTQDEVDHFAKATHDTQWIHRPEAAGRPPFGVPVAHGLYILALLPHLTSGLYDVRGESSAINYRLDRVRFRTPVPIGLRVRARGELLGVRLRPRGFLEVRTAVSMEVAAGGGTLPALSAESVLLFETQMEETTDGSQ
jgi:acyl dehydratase